MNTWDARRAEYDCLCDTPLGPVYLAEDASGITTLRFAGPGDAPRTAGHGRYLRDATAQLAEYFSGARRAFDLPLAPRGSDFQRRVWRALMDIPYGETRSYRDMAERLGNPGAARAVGMANNRNPICIVIPCHRVIGADGGLVGYAGGLRRKRYLLEMEAARANAGGSEEVES